MAEPASGISSVHEAPEDKEVVTCTVVYCRLLLAGCFVLVSSLVVLLGFWFHGDFLLVRSFPLSTFKQVI